jgi:hypothetical protein
VKGGERDIKGKNKEKCRKDRNGEKIRERGGYKEKRKEREKKIDG